MSEFKLPELGENIQGGNVVNVLVSEGDTIKKDDPVLEIETDKATIEVPSAVAGVIKAIHVKSGDKVEVGQLILTTGDGAEEAAPAQPAAQQTEAALTSAPEPEATTGGVATPAQPAAQQTEAAPAPEAEAAPSPAPDSEATT